MQVGAVVPPHTPAINLFKNNLLHRIGAASLLAGVVAHVQAQTSLFSSQVNFNTASSGLVTESFVTLGTEYPHTIGIFGPWDSNGISSPGHQSGAIVPGLGISAGGGGVADANSLGIIRTSDATGVYATVPLDRSVYTNQNLDGTKLIFSFTNGSTTAIGFDYFNPGTDGTLLSTIRVYDTNDALLTSTTTTPAISGAFFGVTSAVAIGSISIENSWFPGVSFNVEAANNISFGTASAIPEPSTDAIIAGISMLGFVIWRRRNRPARERWRAQAGAAPPHSAQ